MPRRPTHTAVMLTGLLTKALAPLLCLSAAGPALAATTGVDLDFDADTATGPLAELAEISGWFVMAGAVFYVLAIQEGKRRRAYLVTGVVLHTLHFVERWIRLGFIPFAEKHDNIILLGLAVACVSIYVNWHERDDHVTLFAVPLILVFCFLGIMTRRLDSISPFLNSPWFFVHVLLTFTSYGFLAVGAILGVLYVRGRNDRFEVLQYRVMVHGWIIYTAALVAGSIWFYMAYGTYWLWTAKELWATLTWFYVGMYLHARLMRGWKGRPAAVMGTLAFAFTLFTYFGVGTIILSPPTPF